MNIVGWLLIIFWTVGNIVFTFLSWKIVEALTDEFEIGRNTALSILLAVVAVLAITMSVLISTIGTL